MILDYNSALPISNLRYVEWIPTLHCNYQCSYCTCAGSSRIERDIVPKVLSYLGKNLAPGAHVNLCGGEPTIHFQFGEIASWLNTKSVSYSLTTNLSQSRQWYERILSEGLCSVKYIYTTFHPEHANFDEYIEKVKFIASKGVRIQVRIIAAHDAYLEVRRWYDKFITAGVWVKPKLEKLRRRHDVRKRTKRLAQYNEVYTTWLTHVLGSEKILTRDIENRGRFCASGWRYQYINPRGDIFRCASAEEVGDRIGTVFSGVLLDGNEGELCVYEFCKCRESERLGLVDVRML